VPKVVLLLGAGATVSDVATRSKIARPPLDKEFFALSRAAGRRTAVDTIAGYMQRTYAVNILNGSDDSLEQVMGQIYTDQLNPTLAADARPAFFALLRLFNERLATTTNNIAATQKRFLYRILSYYLSEGITPSDLTMVTFNQDLQAEKILHLLASKAKWRKCSAQLFNFPHCYELGVPTARVTSPAGGSVDEVFDEHTPDDERVRVLKLHGSLNWYSTHNSRTPSPRALFNQSRLLSITRRRAIYVDMTISGPSSRQRHTIPVVIPPVTHKTSVLHNEIQKVWTLAEARLTEAEHLVVFGYSCPALDFEATNMLRRSQLASSHVRTISLIDPDPATATRFINLLSPSKLSYYPYAEDFLTDHPH
jgi:hypothetical protein